MVSDIVSSKRKLVIPGSSNGRTDDSGSFNRGSNPCPGVFYYLGVCKYYLQWQVVYPIYRVPALIIPLFHLSRLPITVMSCLHSPSHQEHSLNVEPYVRIIF